MGHQTFGPSKINPKGPHQIEEKHHHTAQKVNEGADSKRNTEEGTPRTLVEPETLEERRDGYQVQKKRKTERWPGKH